MNSERQRLNIWKFLVAYRFVSATPLASNNSKFKNMIFKLII